MIEAEFSPSAYNIGFNVGVADEDVLLLSYDPAGSCDANRIPRGWQANIHHVLIAL